MIKTMSCLFDEAKPCEIETLVNQNAVTDLSADVLLSIKNKVYVKTGISNAKKKRIVAVRIRIFAAVAAMLALVIGLLLGTGVLNFSKSVPTNGVIETTPVNKVTESAPVIDVTTPEVENAKVYSPDEIKEWAEFENIVWGNGPLGLFPTISGEEQSEVVEFPSIKTDNYVDWNGIILSKALNNELNILDSDSVLAITVQSMKALDGSINDYVNDGRTYEAILVEYYEIGKDIRTVSGLTKAAESYDRLKDRMNEEGKERWWSQVFDTTRGGEEFVRQFLDGDEFLLDKIADEVMTLEKKKKELANELDAFVGTYYTECCPIPDLKKLAEKEYFVAENEGIYVVFVKAEMMSTFAEDVISLYGSDLIAQTMFTLITQSDFESPGNENT